ncbi:hypothetical protein SprV_0100036900 [Sparganum proliferum]
MCSSFGWFPRKRYLLGNSSALCATELTMENYNIKEGEVIFEYKFTDSVALAYFTVRNDRCVLQDGKSHVLRRSSKHTWRKFQTKVPEGSSTLHWYLYSDYSSGYEPVISEFKLRNVTVTGRSALMECPECEAGYYAATEGASHCSICPKNTFSKQRARECTPCPEGEYAPPGSSECTKMEPCKATDYIRQYTACSTDDTTHLESQTISSIVCTPNGGVAPLPNGRKERCLPCPRGTRVANATTCKSCPSGQFSDDSGRCSKCPAGEAPIFGLKYDAWHRMAPLVSTFCPDADEDCILWQQNGTSVFVGPGLEDYTSSSLQLDLSDGFLTSYDDSLDYMLPYLRPLPNTVLEFDFELHCTEECSLTLKKETLLETFLIHKWTGSTVRRKFLYEITSAEGATFIWNFKRWSSDPKSASTVATGDIVHIYSIAVNNTRATGALGCKKCPLGVDGLRCKPCGQGFFFALVRNSSTNLTVPACAPCPNGSIVISDATSAMTVEQACKPCPPGTRPGSASFCVTDLNPVSPKGQSYKLKNLMTETSVKGARLFTSQGNAYIHNFKFSLNTGDMRNRVHCINDDNPYRNVTSWVCKETLIPKPHSGKENETFLRISPLSIGDTLVSAKPTTYSADHARTINEKLKKAGWGADESGNDLHYYFDSKTSVSGCPNGMSTIVTLRCPPVDYDRLFSKAEKTNSLSVEVPPLCVDGTCDGCNYHFMVLSNYACPICREEDLMRLEGSCNGGQREVNVFAADGCRFDDGAERKFTESCPLLSTKGKIAIGLVVAVVVFLILIIFYCHQRNKKLEYKYMKLVEGAESRVKGSFGSSSPGSDGGPQQQGTECGITEDEQDLEFRRGNSIKTISAGKLDVAFKRSPQHQTKPGVGFGPVIFRGRVAEDSHILTLDEGNTTEAI